MNRRSTWLSYITDVMAREVLDSRGNPTVEVDVTLSDGVVGRASVPSGASTGVREALELRDRDPSRYGGLGVLHAVENVRGRIRPAIVGMAAGDQGGLDGLLIELDGTPDKSSLGANAILGVSVAVARAAAQSAGDSLYSHLARGGPLTLPVPMFNILNGGKHAEGSTDVQEFMVVPSGVATFGHAVRAGAEVFHALGRVLQERGLQTTVGDEGGFAPTVSSNRQALELVLEGIERAGYAAGKQCFIALDVAANELVRPDGGYALEREGTDKTPLELISLYQEWVADYPIISIEDGITEDNWWDWTDLTSKLGGLVQLVGDDLYTTSPELVRRGISEKASNAVLVKLNQIGTVTETLETVGIARGAGWGTVISHRSGETEDTTIADLAVGTSAGQIKAGAPSRGERTAKYNRLLRIEEELGDQASFAGPEVYRRYDR